MEFKNPNQATFFPYIITEYAKAILWIMSIVAFGLTIEKWLV